jgi:hypothetical protein
LFLYLWFFIQCHISSGKKSPLAFLCYVSLDIMPWFLFNYFIGLRISGLLEVFQHFKMLIHWFYLIY